MNNKIIITLICCFLSLNTFAQEGFSVVKIGTAEASTEKTVFAMTKWQGSTSNWTGSANEAQKKLADELLSLLQNDFSFYKKHFEVVKPYSWLSDSLDWDKVKNNGVAYIGLMKMAPVAGSAIEVTFEFYRASDRKLLHSAKETFNEKNLRKNGHKLADETYYKVVGKHSIFTSRIVFVSDRTSVKGDVRKELYIMDFDGKNIDRLTHHDGTVISPAISHDGTKVLYSLIKNRAKERNINLHLLDMRTGKTEMLSNRDGINSGAIFMPDNENILLTLSHSGNAEIYAMNLKSKELKRITQDGAPDVDPSINNDGTKIAFLSGRSGPPNIYIADPSSTEKNVRRVSFVGQFNATPRFSPDGKYIAFASWLDNRFDIFRIDADGGNLYRLTKDFGSNEDPTYSNDGEFIAFSSQRVLSRTKAIHNIYIMDKDGDIIGAVVQDFGNCITPRWSR